ncbi:hypothetical protein GGF32_007795 [Allomyces javanicus]|nr:hypothetical protein GGF32_007795 [Allomyces javanicus]
MLAADSPAPSPAAAPATAAASSNPHALPPPAGPRRPALRSSGAPRPHSMTVASLADMDDSAHPDPAPAPLPRSSEDNDTLSTATSATGTTITGPPSGPSAATVAASAADADVRAELDLTRKRLYETEQSFARLKSISRKALDEFNRVRDDLDAETARAHDLEASLAALHGDFVKESTRRKHLEQLLQASSPAAAAHAMHPDGAHPELDAMRAIAERAHADLLAEAHRRADLEHELADTRTRLETEVAHHLRTRAEADRLADELDVARDLLHRARTDAARVRAELDEVHALSRPMSPSAAVDAAARGRDSAVRPASPALSAVGSAVSASGGIVPVRPPRASTSPAARAARADLIRAHQRQFSSDDAAAVLPPVPPLPAHDEPTAEVSDLAAHRAALQADIDQLTHLRSQLQAELAALATAAAAAVISPAAAPAAVAAAAGDLSPSPSPSPPPLPLKDQVLVVPDASAEPVVTLTSTTMHRGSARDLASHSATAGTGSFINRPPRIDSMAVPERTLPASASAVGMSSDSMSAVGAPMTVLSAGAGMTSPRGKRTRAPIPPALLVLPPSAASGLVSPHPSPTVPASPRYAPATVSTAGGASHAHITKAMISGPIPATMPVLLQHAAQADAARRPSLDMARDHTFTFPAPKKTKRPSKLLGFAFPKFSNGKDKAAAAAAAAAAADDGGVEYHHYHHHHGHAPHTPSALAHDSGYGSASASLSASSAGNSPALGAADGSSGGRGKRKLSIRPGQISAPIAGSLAPLPRASSAMSPELALAAMAAASAAAASSSKSSTPTPPPPAGRTSGGASASASATTTDDESNGSIVSMHQILASDRAPHFFVPITARSKWAKCDICGERGWGGMGNVPNVQCRACGMVAHNKCAAGLPPKCPGEPPDGGVVNLTGAGASPGFPAATVPVSGGGKKGRHGSSGGSPAMMAAAAAASAAAAGATPVFKVDLVQHVAATHPVGLVPVIVDKCIAAVESFGVELEGIYRKPGQAQQVRLAVAEFDRGHVPDLVNDPKYGHDPAVAASVLKQYLRDLPNPLLAYNVYTKVRNALKATADDRGARSPSPAIGDEARDATQRARQRAMRSALADLPPAHMATLAALMRHLRHIVDQHLVTRMTEHNLAVVFGPTLMRDPSNPDTYDMATIDAVDFLLKNYGAVFLHDVPRIPMPRSLLVRSPSPKAASPRGSPALAQAVLATRPASLDVSALEYLRSRSPPPPSQLPAPVARRPGAVPGGTLSPRLAAIRRAMSPSPPPKPNTRQLPAAALAANAAAAARMRQDSFVLDDSDLDLAATYVDRMPPTPREDVEHDEEMGVVRPRAGSSAWMETGATPSPVPSGGSGARASLSGPSAAAVAAAVQKKSKSPARRAAARMSLGGRPKGASAASVLE